ncbi:hypothetical protein QLQ12_32490 [Actinoplanes sp. NEAU-A12]|uniref:Integral membrane protein n=1 Tax=Actinoplanes sandaracinus TaxID=3045177 RepID=A0ABT6WUC1_9ACTN|nr:hypothetical protein [Actinoplanes sandaracinus]MDI6103338.1 hypothetical protein [Actinoplanes sandaracinus]
MAKDDSRISALLTVEYERLKEEQKVRIGMRDNLIYVTLASMAAVIAAMIQAGGRPGYLLLLPPVTFLLGWTYLANDQKISDIGRYIREQLGPRLTTLAGDDVSVFGWETAHRAGPGRARRKLTQLLVDLMAFCLAPLVGVIAAWINGELPRLLFAVSVVEVALLALLAASIVREVELKGR